MRRSGGRHHGARRELLTQRESNRLPGSSEQRPAVPPQPGDHRRRERGVHGGPRHERTAVRPAAAHTFHHPRTNGNDLPPRYGGIDRSADRCCRHCEVAAHLRGREDHLGQDPRNGLPRAPRHDTRRVHRRSDVVLRVPQPDAGHQDPAREVGPADPGPACWRRPRRSRRRRGAWAERASHLESRPSPRRSRRLAGAHRHCFPVVPAGRRRRAAIFRLALRGAPVYSWSPPLPESSSCSLWAIC